MKTPHLDPLRDGCRNVRRTPDGPQIGSIKPQTDRGGFWESWHGVDHRQLIGRYRQEQAAALHILMYDLAGDPDVDPGILAQYRFMYAMADGTIVEEMPAFDADLPEEMLREFEDRPR
jgi:hypothetical protein